METDTGYATFQDALAEITDIGNRLGEATTKVQATADDPKAMSMALYNRSWTNFRGFTMLWKADLILEAEIILRSSVETAICLANLDLRRSDFIADLADDVSHTMIGQVKMMRRANYGFSETVANDWADELQSKGKRLDLEKLAGQANVSDLYSYHRVLSGTSVHISGISIARHSPFTPPEEDPNLYAEAAANDRKRVVLWMVPTMTTTLLAHARIIESQDHIDRIAALLLKLKPAVEQYAMENQIEIPVGDY